jgi:hypothetical protein
MCFLVVVMTPQAVPLALCLPSIYCIFSEKIARTNPVIVGLVPGLLIFIPAFFHSVILYFCLLGCGILLRRYIQKHDIGLAVLVPTCLMFSLFMISILIIASSEGTTYSAIISRWVDNIMIQVTVIYENMLSPDELMQFKMSRSALQARIINIFPSIMGTTFAFVMWLNLLIVSSIKRNIKLRAWKCPDWVVALFILAGITAIIRVDAVQVFGLNLLIVVSQVYFYQGLAIVASYMAGNNWAKIFRWIIYVLILSQIYIMIIVSALGLFDTWFNFRNRIRNSQRR